MTVIVTDGPSTMKNTLMKALTIALGVRHHVVLSYTPWSNGVIERQNKEILKVLRAIMSESGPKWTLERWPELVTLLQYALNTTRCETLGMSPLEAFCGRRPKTTVDLLAFHGHDFKSIETTTIPVDRIREHVETICTAIRESGLHMLERKRRKHVRSNKGRTPPEEARLHIGDYVLLARKRPKQSKLQCSWTGPYVLVEPVTDFIWSLRALDDKTLIDAHVQRIKRYSDASLNRTRALNLQAQNELDQFEAEKFMDWRVNPSGQRVELLVRWKGFTDAWDTFEDVESHLWGFAQMRKDIIKYLARHSGAHTAIAALLGRLQSRSKSRTISRRNRAASRPEFYQRQSGGWVARALGSQRVFSTRKRAVSALRKEKRDSAKASGIRGLGGSVAMGLTSAPNTEYKTTNPKTYYWKNKNKKCQLRGCRRTIEPGMCPATGKAKQACCLTHHKMHKAGTKAQKDSTQRVNKKTQHHKSWAKGKHGSNRIQPPKAAMKHGRPKDRRSQRKK